MPYSEYMNTTTTTTLPTSKQLVAVGRYTKSTDPEMVSRMRTDGYKTTARAVGEYLHDVDSYMFWDTVDYLGN